MKKRKEGKRNFKTERSERENSREEGMKESSKKERREGGLGKGSRKIVFIRGKWRGVFKR